MLRRTYLVVLLAALTALSAPLTASANAYPTRDYLTKQEIRRDVAKAAGTKFGFDARKFLEAGSQQLIKCNPSGDTNEADCTWRIPLNAVNGRAKGKEVWGNTSIWLTPCNSDQALTHECWETSSAARWVKGECVGSGHPKLCATVWKWRGE